MPETIAREARARRERVQEGQSALERMRYLCPSRYFRFFMFYERVSHRTCWLPEGYDA